MIDSCNCETLFDYATKVERVKELDAAMAAPDFWSDQETAQKVLGEVKTLKKVTVPLADAISSLEDMGELLVLLEEDASLASEIDSELARVVQLLDNLELQALLSGPHDDCGAILSVHARDGGVDANDWAEMLFNMYLAWAKANDCKIEVIDFSENEEAGITRATVAVRGSMAYGYLKGEEGTHRLVRISPFNAEGKRKTSFAAVDVSPEFEQDVEIEIDEKDVREDTYRASGAGGQHVNKTDSAVRLTHIPTGLSVQCQSDRSQHSNRATAWKMLKARLARIEEEKREAEQAAKYSNKPRVGFGSQIRNYFLHPDQRVKDARTGFQVGNFHSVMAGEIQGFLDAFLRFKMKEESEA